MQKELEELKKLVKDMPPMSKEAIGQEEITAKERGFNMSPNRLS